MYSVFPQFCVSSFPNMLKKWLLIKQFIFFSKQQSSVGHLDAYLAENLLSRRNPQSFYSWSYRYMIVNTRCKWSVIIKCYHWFSISIEQEIYFDCSITPPFPSVRLKSTTFFLKETSNKNKYIQVRSPYQNHSQKDHLHVQLADKMNPCFHLFYKICYIVQLLPYILYTLNYTKNPLIYI